MEPINVLLTWPTGDEAKRIVASVDPRVRVASVPYVEPEELRNLRRKGQWADRPACR